MCKIKNLAIQQRNEQARFDNKQIIGEVVKWESPAWVEEFKKLFK